MSMYVLEGVGSIMPVTQGQVQQITTARAQAIRAQTRDVGFGGSGFGDLVVGPVRDIIGHSTPEGGFLRDYGYAAVSDFMGTWGVPIGVGLGALAVGLVMAKTIRKRKRKAA